jgi:hypothetical protein
MEKLEEASETFQVKMQRSLDAENKVLILFEFQLSTFVFQANYLVSLGASIHS